VAWQRGRASNLDVRAGLGLTTLPLSLLPGRGRLAIVDIEPAPIIEVALALPADRPPKATTQAFVNLVATLHPASHRANLTGSG
jgi:DNA-binding transcriptional LysR family regulator